MLVFLFREVYVGLVFYTVAAQITASAEPWPLTLPPFGGHPLNSLSRTCDRHSRVGCRSMVQRRADRTKPYHSFAWFVYLIAAHRCREQCRHGIWGEARLRHTPADSFESCERSLHAKSPKHDLILFPIDYLSTIARGLLINQSILIRSASRAGERDWAKTNDTAPETSYQFKALLHIRSCKPGTRNR